MPETLSRHNLQVVRGSNSIRELEVTISPNAQVRFKFVFAQVFKAALALSSGDALVKDALKKPFQEAHFDLCNYSEFAGQRWESRFAK